MNSSSSLPLEFGSKFENENQFDALVDTTVNENNNQELDQILDHLLSPSPGCIQRDLSKIIPLNSEDRVSYCNLLNNLAGLLKLSEEDKKRDLLNPNYYATLKKYLNQLKIIANTEEILPSDLSIRARLFAVLKEEQTYNQFLNKLQVYFLFGFTDTIEIIKQRINNLKLENKENILKLADNLMNRLSQFFTKIQNPKDSAQHLENIILTLVQLTDFLAKQSLTQIHVISCKKILNKLMLIIKNNRDYKYNLDLKNAHDLQRNFCQTMDNAFNEYLSTLSEHEKSKEEYLYYSSDQSHRGRFGYSNPDFYFNKSSSINLANLQKKCEKNLKTNLDSLINNLLSEISTHKSLFKPTIGMFFKKLWYGNQDNSNGGETALKTSVSDITRILNNETKIASPLEHIKRLAETYYEKIHSPAELGSSLQNVKDLYANQFAKICRWLNQHKLQIEFLSSNTHFEKPNPSLLEECYHFTALEKNRYFISRVIEKNNSLWINFLKKISSNNNTYDNVISGIFADLTDAKQPLTANQYTDLICKLIGVILSLRLRHVNYVDTQHANILEKFCCDLITTHVLGDKDQLSLTFSEEQLNTIYSQVYFLSNSREDNIRTQELVAFLDKKLRQNPQSENNHPELFLFQKEFLISGLKQTINEEFTNLKVFQDAFIRKMNIKTLSQIALSSSDINATMGIIGQIGSIFEIPGIYLGKVAHSAAISLDQNQQINQAKNCVENMPNFLIWMEMINNILAPRLATIFRAQILNMKNTKDVERFAEFCRKRMFAALRIFKENRPEWSENLNMIDYLTVAVFKMPNKLTRIPFLMDHYHQADDTSWFGHSTFQKMVNSVSYYVDHSNENTSTTHSDNEKNILNNSDIYINERLLNPSKKSNKSGIKHTLLKYGSIDLSPLKYNPDENNKNAKEIELISADFAEALASRTNRKKMSANPQHSNWKKTFYSQPTHTVAGFFGTAVAAFRYTCPVSSTLKKKL